MPGDPDWRHDPLTGRRVLISPVRGERPRHSGPACPFCEGHEAETPSEVLAFREAASKPNGPGWRVRVVPNRYAAVRMDLLPPLRFGKGGRGGEVCGEQAQDPSPQPPPRSGEGEKLPGVGVAEVFLECPQHETRFRNLPLDHAAEVIRAWRERLRYWRDDGRLAFAQFFKNEGPMAGASVEHCHSQLIGLDFVPPQILDELPRSSANGECLHCRWLERKTYFVMESNEFVVLCPSAPRFPGETWILPRRHEAAFESLADDSVQELASVLKNLLDRIGRVFNDPDFNLIVKSAPFRYSGSYHWRIEVVPRPNVTAGFEWGTGLIINTMLPERAADLLCLAFEPTARTRD